MPCAPVREIIHELKLVDYLPYMRINYGTKINTTLKFSLISEMKNIGYYEIFVLKLVRAVKIYIVRWLKNLLLTHEY